MEFRCRFGTPSGEIIEGVYVAENEARLRREFEEKGLYVLAIQRAGRAALRSFRLPRRSRISSREFLVFNQELATLLKAGMPLVQSLDILRQRVANPLFKSVLDDVYERVRAGNSLSEAFEAQGTLFPGIYTASLLAGEKSGSLEQVIRRYVAYVKVDLGRQAQDDLRAGVSRDPAGAVAASWSASSCCGRAGVRRRSTSSSARNCRSRRASSVAFSNFVVGVFPVSSCSRRGDCRGVDWLAEAAGKAAAVRPDGSSAAGSVRSRKVRDVAGGANAGDTARRRHPAGQRHRCVGAIDSQPVHGARADDGCAAGARRARAAPPSMMTSGAFPDVAIKMVEVGESTGALQEMLNSLSEFYDEEIETNLARFITIVEPALLVIMGIIIAALLLSLYMPLFNLSSMR